MKLLSSRSLASLRPTLQNPDSTGPDPVYQVFAKDDPKWANQTVVTSGRIGQEFPKTFGHYHGTAVEETYRVVSGQGVFLLQSKKIIAGDWAKNQVEKVYLVKASPGDEITITPEWGHSWSNIGDQDLVTVDNWRAGHSPTDYQVMELEHGMAYYLIDQDGTPTPLANSHYIDLPKPIWISAEEFKNHI